MNIQDKMRAQYTRRWTTVHLDHQQSLAEHSFNVAMLAMELAKSVFHVVTPEIKAQVLEYALLHDIDEVVTGDIPTPTKKRLSSICPKIGDVIAAEGETKAKAVTQEVVSIVKVADMIEGAFHVKQHAAGVHAIQVADHCEDVMRKTLENGDLADETLFSGALELWHTLNNGARYW